jgi:hypothetical protein
MLPLRRTEFLARLVFLLASACTATAESMDARTDADAASAACGALGASCCNETPPCGPGLRCNSGTCSLPPMHCTVAGIADPSIVTADFATYYAPDCTDVPPEVIDPLTPGMFAPNSRGIGRIDCEGLAPGPATLTFTARVRLPATDRTRPDDCFCNSPWMVGLDLVVEGQQSFSLFSADRSTLDLGAGDAGDGSCRDGPDFDESYSVNVGFDGRLSVRVDLGTCWRASSDTHCLFLAGTTLRVTQ